MKDYVVKIDYKLKKRIEKFMSQGDNYIEFPSIKNFIDKAVLNLLKKVEKNENK